MGKKKASVDIVLPIYNEEKELEESVTTLHSYLSRMLRDYQWQILIVDNASQDKSSALATRLSKELPRVSSIHLDEKGRGRAVKTAWRKSTADFLCYMDVDLSTDLSSLSPLLSALRNGYDIAIGSRLLVQSRVLNRTLRREILSRGYNFLIKLFFHTHFSDAQCGFKAIRRRVVDQLLPYVEDTEWFFDSELLILAERCGYTIHEEPVLWIDNPGSTVRVLGTVKGDLLGLFRLYRSRPWKKRKKNIPS